MPRRKLLSFRLLDREWLICELVRQFRFLIPKTNKETVSTKLCFKNASHLSIVQTQEKNYNADT